MHSISYPNFILGLALLLGAGLGALMQLSHFCTMGAIADSVLFHNFQRAKLFALALAVALIGTHILEFLHWIDTSKSVYKTHQLLWLSHCVGGFCFGTGMVLTGGCVSKQLVRLGTGSLKSLMVLLVLAFSAAMTMRGIISPLRINGLNLITIQMPNKMDSSFNILGISSLMFSILIGLGLITWSIWNKQEQNSKHCFFGILIGSFIIMAWILSGVLAYIPEHPDTLQEAFLATNSNKMENILLIASAVSWLNYLLLFTDSSQILTLSMLISMGMIVGSATVSLYQKNFQWQGFVNRRDWIQHILGAGLMGFGGVVAMGCSISHGLGGLSVLSLGSFLSVIHIIAGAVCTLKYLSK